MTSQATLDLVSRLTAEEARSLIEAVMLKERARARADAPAFGDLFASCLRIAGEPELARQVGVILDTLRQNFVSKNVR